MKNGRPVNPYSQLHNTPVRSNIPYRLREFILCKRDLVNSYNYFYEFNPRNFYSHHSIHYIFFFLASVYFPWRYEAIIGNIPLRLFKMSAKSTIRNSILRNFTVLLTYSIFIYTGQVLARWWWTYKRSYNASNSAVWSTYISHKIREPYS